MIWIVPGRKRLVLQYAPDAGTNPAWVRERFNKKLPVRIVSSFTFEEGDLIGTDGDHDDLTYEFVLGVKDGKYFRIPARVLNTDADVLFHADMQIAPKFFTAPLKISIMPKISALVAPRELVVGGDRVDAMPQSDFETLIATFPNTGEQRKYVYSTIGRLLKEHFALKPDPEKAFDDHIERVRATKAAPTLPVIAEIEAAKYTFLRDEIARLLKTSESYSERQWQRLIARFILIMFPKYLYVAEEVQVRDAFSGKKRRMDLLLIDVNGYVDVIEIKRPADGFLITATAGSGARGNFTPRKGLSDTVIQAEKYIFHLSKWGSTGEADIAGQLRKKRIIPDSFEIRVANPRAMIIAGRSKDLSSEQRADFEIIRRHYANMVDVMTYDDLLDRLDRLIAKFEAQS